MTIRLSVGAFLLSSAGLAACAAAPESVTTSEARQTEVKALTTVKGREYARCWFDVAGDNAQLSCKTTARGEDPLGASAKVAAASMTSPTTTPIGASLDIEAGGTIVVGSFPRSAFPIYVMMSAQLSADGIKAVGARRNADWSNNVKIDRPESLPPSRPQILGQPFDIWPVAFIDARGDWSAFAVNAREYKRSLAPYAAFGDETEMTLAPSFFTRDFKGKVTLWIAPASGGITIGVQSGQPDVALPGPGYYAMTSAGFGPATPEQIALDFAAATPTPTAPPTTEPATTGPATTDPATTEPPTLPPTPVDADPTCGGDGQPTCGQGAARSCDAGTRYDGSSKCVACGGAGQTYCYVDPNGASFDAGGRRCDAGTRFDGASKCIPCGGAGQTYCYVDPKGVSFDAGGRRCDAGTRFDGSSKCIECGGEGQTYCYSDAHRVDPSSAKTCDDGLTVKNSRCSR